MEGDPGATEKLYRLRLVLPDLSQEFVGNWLVSLEKSIPPDSFQDDDGFFDPSEGKRSGQIASKHSHVEANYQLSDLQDVGSDSTRCKSAKIDSSHEFWLRVGQMPSCGPVLRTWELCHGLENWLLEKNSEGSHERTLPHVEIQNCTLGNMPLSNRTNDDFEVNAAKLTSEFSPYGQTKLIPESDLLKDALYALQGLPAAVRKLERLSQIYSTISADKNAQNLSTLWTRSVTALGLGKILSVLARAGHVRCQLEAFVSFFLDGRFNAQEENSDHKSGRSRENASMKKKKKKKKKKKTMKTCFTTEVIEYDKPVDSADIPVNTASSEKRVPSYCLVNQAFAEAVKEILHGHSAALNTLASSVSFRREPADSIANDLLEQGLGPLIGYENRDISLLEFYLHTRELRVQLQSLAFICLMRDGKSFVGSISGDVSSENWSHKGYQSEQGFENVKGTDLEHGRGDSKCDPLENSFDSFPRGADLLTYLYDQLMEVDPLHMELLRFLFERAYEPYSNFIRSWLYQAAVKDPYGEFVIEQADFRAFSAGSNVAGKKLSHNSDLRMRRGLFVPRFMENICTQLIRAGEQLQILLQLAQTSELAQKMAINNARISGMFEGFHHSTGPLVASSRRAPALVFSKKELDEIVHQREKNSQEMRQQFDSLFTELADMHVKEERSATDSRSSTQSSLSTGIDMPQIDGKEVSVGNSELLLSTSAELERQTYDRPSKLQASKDSYLEVKFVLPKRGWLRSAGSKEADDSLPFPKVKSGSLLQVGKKQHSAPSVLKEAEEAGEKAIINVTAKGSRVEDSQHPTQAWILPDADGVSTGGTKSSLISDHQRGTSWPLWGLPVNPFLVHSDIDESTSRSYVHTSFMGMYHHWDVTAKSIPASANSSQPSGLDMSGESSKLGRESNIEPPWFASLEFALHNQLLEGLDAQIKMLSGPQADFEDVRLEAGPWEPSEHLVQVLDHGQASLNNLPDLGTEVPACPTSSEKVTDMPNFSSVVEPDSDVQVDAKSTSELTLFSGLSWESEAPRDIALPRTAVVQDDTVTEGVYSSSLPPNGECIYENNSSGNLVRGLYPVYTGAEESGLMDSSECKETPRILEEAPNFSQLKADDVSVDSRTDLAALASEISGFQSKKVHHSMERVQPQALENDEVKGPTNWEQCLRFAGLLNSGAVEEIIGDGMSMTEVCVDEAIPLSVVVSKCIAEEILSQYQCVSTLTVRLFQEGLCLQDHYAALRRYFFMERGDWADYFMTALCQHRWGPSRGQHRQMEVQGLLEAALQRSSCEGDEYAERVYVSFQESSCFSGNPIHDSRTSQSSFVDSNRLDAFDFIALEYRVDWPLNLILTGHSLRLYNVVFTFLMRIKLTVHALGGIWQQLQVIDRSLHKERRSSTFQQQRTRFRTLQQFRQQIYHFITTVQRYVEAKLLSDVWSKFLQDIQMEVNDMQDLETMHCLYLEDAVDGCFLSTKTSGVQGCIGTIMQCVLDFSSCFHNVFDQNQEKSDLIGDHLFARVHQVKEGFQVSLQRLHAYHLKQEPQSRDNLSDLWMILDFNGFLTNVLSAT